MTHVPATPPLSTHDTTRIDDLRIGAVRPLLTPALLQEWLPTPPAHQALVESSRAALTRVLHGQDDRLIVVVGPCSIHDHGQAMEYARRLKEQADALAEDLLVVMRVAYEAQSGRPRWVRRFGSEPTDTTAVSNSWQMSLPVLRGPWLYTVAPDRSGVARLDRATGRLVGLIPADRLAGPAYLLTVGPQLACVSENRVATVPFEADGPWAQRPVRLSPVVPAPGLRGRVAVAGDRLLAPVTSGLLVMAKKRSALSELQAPLREDSEEGTRGIEKRYLTLLVGRMPALALGVALYITKAPVPFINKVPPRTAEQDQAETERNRNWDPNGPLSGRMPVRLLRIKCMGL